MDKGRTQKQLEGEADTKIEKYAELEGEIELREAEAEKLRTALEAFSSFPKNPDRF